MVRKAVIVAHAKKSDGSTSSSGAQRFEVVTSHGDAEFWGQVYERVREIESVRNLRVTSISIEEC